MTIYVDDMHKSPMGRLGRMRMSHMIGTDEQELHDMAARIGVVRKWYQGDHYDVALSARKKAVDLGAVEITIRETGMMMILKRKTGMMPPLQEARDAHAARMAVLTQGK